MGKKLKPLRRKMRTILWADDEQFHLRPTVDLLEEYGYKVLSARDGSSTLATLKANADLISLVIVDIMMPPGDELKSIDTFDGRRTGLLLAQQIHRDFPRLPLVGCSVVSDPEVVEWFHEHGAGYLIKPFLGRELVQVLDTILLAKTAKRNPRCFIVHGHDQESLYELKNYLQNTLGFEEPIVLRDEPSLGKTIVEKFEDVAESVDLVFVLLTPDDKISPETATDAVKRRARQNVIFEMGFFYAKLQRKSGRVLLLHKGQVELPSDISGIVYMDISHGIQSAGEEIRMELSEWL